MIDLDALLEPIEEDNPAGENLRYEPVYDEIKLARQEDDPNLPQGEWKRERKVADWPKVVKLTTDVLENRSKDLQIAAWLTEGLLRRHGFAGLREGLQLMRRLQEEFWDDVHPQLDDPDDLEFRAVPLEWIGQYLEPAVKSAPLVREGFGLYQYEESRRVGSEEEAEKDAARKKAREEAIAEGKLTAEDFDGAFDQTPKPWLKEMVATLEGCREELEALDGFCEEKYEDVAPSFLNLRENLDEVARIAQRLLDRKLEQDPDPPEEEAHPGEDAERQPGEAGMAAAGAAEAPAAAATGRSAGEAATSGAVGPPARLGSWTDATDAVASAARFLRKEDPTNPAPYLMLRGLRWGELRAGGSGLEPRLLEAPPTQVRTRLKGLLLDAEWEQLLEGAEDVMASPWGRGWLDLQRYVITALDGLGEEYDVVAESVLQSIRGLLAHHPELLEMTLMDDSPTANRETTQWLHETVLDGTDPESESLERSPDRARRSEARVPDSRALNQLRSSDPRRAVQLLMKAAAQEQSARARFLRRSEATRIMVDEGMETVALPILQEMLDQIERHSLEEWESGNTVAGPMSLLYRCMDRLDGDPGQKQDLYLRVCRLDPMEGMKLDSDEDQGSQSQRDAAASAEGAGEEEAVGGA